VNLPHDFHELLRTLYVFREGRSPAGVLDLVQWWATLLAEEAGAALDRADGETRPARPDEKSGRAVAVDCRHIHHVEQTEATQRDHVAARDVLVAAKATRPQAEAHDRIIAQLRELFASAAARGIRLDLRVERAAVPER